LTCFLVAFGMVLPAGSAVAQLVIDYSRDRHWTQRSGRQGLLNNSLVFPNMKQTLFMLTLVLTLGSIADSSAYAQNGKVGPMAKLTPNLVNLHAQHTFHLARRKPRGSRDAL
jgi:hypothetical protein